MKHPTFSRPILSICILSLACLAALAGGTPAAFAQSPAAAGSDAASAWSELRAAVQQKLQTAEGSEKSVREVLADLEQFAATHAGTPEAAFALLNHGDLALELGDEGAAERSFRKAAELATDPQLTAHIESQLAQLAVRPGKTPPDFAANTITGGTISPRDFQGRVVLLDFWATWCGPCIAELPNVQAVYREHHEAGFDIVSISLDQDKAALTRFLKQREMPWTHVLDADLPPDASIAAKYGVNAIPFMVLIGRNGTIAGVNLRGPALAKAVHDALAKPSENEIRSDKS